MSYFYICHCGNTNSPHNFKHSFVKTSKVLRKNKNNLEYFVFDSKLFPEFTKTKCKIENCNSLESIHDGEIIEHAYEPKEIKYKKIKLSLPQDSICNICHILLKHHFVKENLSLKNNHCFKTKLKISSNTKDDEIFIIDYEDDDKKIEWK